MAVTIEQIYQLHEADATLQGFLVDLLVAGGEPAGNLADIEALYQTNKAAVGAYGVTVYANYLSTILPAVLGNFAFQGMKNAALSNPADRYLYDIKQVPAPNRVAFRNAIRDKFLTLLDAALTQIFS